MDESRIYVRVIGETISTKELEIYFQSRKQSGGGDISKIEQINEKESVITFEDHEAARNVTLRTHTINGASVEVSRHPFIEENSEAPANQTAVVIIRGLSKDTTEDALTNYLENTRRSGGGEVKEVAITGNSARVKFESVKVANSVVQREKHTLNEATLDVSLEVCEGQSKVGGKTIKVTGLAEKTTKDSIINYFENERRSGGGAVESVEFQCDTGVALLTFEDANVVTNVLQHDKHSIDGAALSVSQSYTTSVLTDKEEIQESRTIEVTGLASATTKDSIVNFFENTRRSGGGEIENVDFMPDKGYAVVTFISAQSALRVVNKEKLTLDEAEVQLTLRKPVKKLPTDAMRVLVKGLSEKTTSDGLTSYMEVVSGLEVSGIEFGDQGCALVTFSNAYDYELITKKTAKRKLEGNLLTLERVPVCHCVQVTGLNKENTTKDAVLYYFENPKNGGGNVTDVEIRTDEGWALVCFEDPQVVTKVMAKSHILNGAKLQLSLHNPVLAKPVCPSELVNAIPVDAQVMPFVFERHQAGLSLLQEKHGVKISCIEGSNNLTVIPVNKTAEKNRFDDACKAVASFFHGFLKKTMRATPDTWKDIEEHFKDSRTPMKDRVDIQYLNQRQEIVVIGISQDVESLAEDVMVLKKTIEGEKAIEASKTTKTVNDVPKMRLKVLSDLDFDKELENKYEHTQVNIFPDKGQVQIRGPPEAIHKAVADVWQAVANTKDVSVEMPKNAVEVLRTRACQSFIKQHFTANNLQALLVFNEEDETTDTVFVMGMNSESAHKAAKILQEMIIEENLILDEGQVQLEKSEKWRQLRDELTEKFVLSMKLDRSSNKLWLAGRKEDVSSAFVYIKRFFKENTIVSEIVELPRGCRRFLAKYREQDIRKIQEELNKHSTVIKGMEDDDDKDIDVVVSGTTDGVEKGTKMIEDLASTVEIQKVPLNKPGMRKALKRSKGKKMLVLLENEVKCVIHHFNAHEVASLEKKSEEEKDETKKTKKESECSFLTPEGKIISVFKDNICDRTVDVIVNAANTRLRHSSGVAKAIVDAGGETIQDECDQCIIEHGSILEGQVVVTSAGKLPFKKVIHAVGPLWRKEATREKSLGKTPKEEKLLRYAVSNALQEASAFTSIALPAISTGASGCPRDLCAKIMVDAALEFCEENPSCLLSEIQFTSTDGAVVTAFVNEMNTRSDQDPSFQSKEKSALKIVDKGQGKSRSKVKPTSPAPVLTHGPNFVTTQEGLKLVLVTGDMTREEVDAIVNSTSSDLDLSRNASAKALSAAAGPKLQQECSAIGQVRTGGIVVTGGGNLGCKHVFHTSCASWETGKGEQVLRDIIKKSLEEAQKRSLSSIAIPAIGTGNLQFPHGRVAAASFEGVMTFSKKNPSSSLKEVHLVVYDKDLSSVQAFQTELQSRKRSLPRSTAPEDSGKKKGRRARGAAAKKLDLDDSPDVGDTFEKVVEELDPLKPEIAIGGITVQAEAGDITQEVTDAIVTVSNNELNVAFGGGVGKAILSAGGPSIQAECSALGIQTPGAIAVTGAGRLKTRKIYHMVPDKLNMSSLKDSIVKCLRAADSHGLTSISFPAVGTGNFNVRVKESAEEMLAAIAKFAQEQPMSLHSIRIVIFQRHMLQDFYNAMDACMSSLDDGPGFFSKIAGGIAGFFGFGKSGSPSSYPAASKRRMSEKEGSYLEIFAGTKQDIKRAVEEIQKDLADQCTTRVIEKDAISNLSKEQRKTVMDLALNHDVTINLEMPVGRISVRGDPEDVLDVATSIHEILNQKLEEEHTRGIEELISKNIQWYYYEDEDLEAYDTSVNSQIENAYGAGQSSVIVLIDDARCEVVFKDMKETCLEDGEERVVVRKEIGKGIPLPVEWSVQPKDSLGKEKDVHLVQLDPINHAKEYSRVADEIKKTASITITKIERVQNPGLYRAYMVRKDQMDQKSGGNEKFLFHGTAQGSCSSINKFGFNRSYCGKNATVYGNGVYFARDASYSTQSRYSPPDATGNRYLYLAHVLVGEYTVGRPGMITPPAKGSDATDAYDSVVDNTGGPSIFVVFYDNQCYPDYLVTFK